MEGLCPNSPTWFVRNLVEAAFSFHCFELRKHCVDLAGIFRDFRRLLRFISFGEGIDIGREHPGERKHRLRQLFYGGETDLDAASAERD